MGEGDQGDLVKVEVGGELVPMDGDQEIARLRAEIDATRDRIRESIDNLQEEIEETIDWRGWVKENPYKTVGMAFALGFLLGSS